MQKEDKVVATDLSPVAVAVAAYNVQRYCLQVSDFSSFFQSPCFPDNSFLLPLFPTMVLPPLVFYEYAESLKHIFPTAI